MKEIRVVEVIILNGKSLFFFAGGASFLGISSADDPPVLIV